MACNWPHITYENTMEQKHQQPNNWTKCYLLFKCKQLIFKWRCSIQMLSHGWWLCFWDMRWNKYIYIKQEKEREREREIWIEQEEWVNRTQYRITRVLLIYIYFTLCTVGFIFWHVGFVHWNVLCNVLRCKFVFFIKLDRCWLRSQCTD